ncbi:MAG: Rrf2 family transcriptional regulator [Cellvibrionales bacterium]|jgi:Rrf2 family nitric oxide-sensitive transcriptional repressor|nr:Rrf2 family transcriptional regulator [Cellvibrionales bacterium]MBK8676735.1 Rrf2 family transcriptional regulator [Cellvibrionales bacterium]HRG50143.1 Rrf2 family transcriptional regulator [Pseudomonadales bacterium]
MRLSRFSDYAVRVLIYSAMQPERLVTLQEMSDFYGISLAHLRKVVHKLGKLGYLKTARGKGGGLRLQRDASEINIGEVVAAFEGKESLIDCAGLDCVVLPACGLPRVLRRAQAAFYSELDSHTLQDVIKQDKFPRVLEAVDKRRHAHPIIAFS